MNIQVKTTGATVLLATVLMFSGCTSTPKLSDSLYRAGEEGYSKRTERCRVLAVRKVMMRDEQSEAKEDGFFGSIAGAVLGATLGSDIGGGTGNLLATEAGSILGAGIGSNAGSALSDKLSEREAIEYSIILASGEERTMVQEFLEGDRVVPVGSTCRLQMAGGGRNRVLPAEGLASEIQAPKTTSFYE